MADSSSYIWNFFRGKGLSEKATAAVMGNLYRESGFDPTAASASYGTVGLAQWRYERNSGLKEYAQKSGSHYTDLTTQLNYVWEELSGRYHGVLSYLQNDQHSMSQMTQYFNNKYEISGDNGVKRVNFATNFFNKFTGSAVDSSLVDTSNLQQSQSAGVWASIVKVLFVVVLIVLGVVFFMNAFSISSPVSKVKKAASKAYGKG